MKKKMNADVKKVMGIEELLQWAFCQELCKVGAAGDRLTTVAGSNWSVTQDMATLGTLIDKSPNAFGVIPGFIEDGEPHRDALLVGEAVRGLARIGFEIPAGWMPFPEMDDPHGLIASEVERVACEVRLKGERLSGRHLVALVTGAAILGRGPDWHCEQPAFRMVSAAGKPRWFVKKTQKDALGRVYEFETDGFDRKRSRPVSGAYRKYELSQMMRGDILSRLDWQLWRDALGFLADSLSGRLHDHAIYAFVADRQPWVRAAKMRAQMQAVEKAS
ncbi:hypothetical protein [Rhizobium sp. SGZ-381]|uniref:hypothetical protein n=1 Tax=Rhizobium sp. SGZ-381 TaxID=3342800 RepID=UPI003672696F